jgi:hypothetical protein
LLNQGGLSARFLWNCNFSLLKDVFNLINLNEPKFKKIDARRTLTLYFSH